MRISPGSRGQAAEVVCIREETPEMNGKMNGPTLYENEAIKEMWSFYTIFEVIFAREQATEAWLEMWKHKDFFSAKHPWIMLLQKYRK